MTEPCVSSLEHLQPFLKKQNNAQDVVYFSKIPQICLEEPCMLGVDEAGRGPVLGPMVYGIAFAPLAKSSVLKDLGCADSKQLTEQKREEIFENINTKEYASESMGWAIEVLSPNVISTSMLRRVKRSLNEVSMDSAINLITRAVELGVNIAEVYVDTVGPPEKYQQKLQAIFPDFQITVAKKADSTFPIVSAASICAKVARDHALQCWQFREGLDLTQKDFGSGYPGDPTTKEFLQKNIDPVFGYPRLVRFSWSTASTALLGKAYDIEFDDEPEDEASRSNHTGPPITSFFSKSDKPIAKRRRNDFFRQRCLDNVTNL